MNSELQQFARGKIASSLSLLPKTWQDKFARMYGDVETMNESNLSRAMDQVQRSVEKYERQQSEETSEKAK